MQKNVLLYSASKMGFAMILINGNTALTCFWSTKLKIANHFKKDFTENRTVFKLQNKNLYVKSSETGRQTDRRTTEEVTIISKPLVAEFLVQPNRLVML